jgi:hypothetical protein
MNKHCLSTLFFFTFVGLTLTGCLKKPEVVDNTTRLMTEFKNGRSATAGNVAGINVGIDLVADTITIDLAEVMANFRSAVKSSYTIRVDERSAILGDYNTQNGTNYVAPPLGAVMMKQQTLTITPSQRSAKIRAVIRPSAMANGQYGLGLTIGEVSDGEISNVANQVAVLFTIKNQYDGVYRSKGSFTHPTPANNSSWTFADGITRDLVTYGPSTVEVAPLRTLAVTFAVGMDLTVNTDNSVNVEFWNTTDDPDPVPNPSRYDPATRRFFIDATYLGGTRRLVDTLEYVRPR